MENFLLELVVKLSVFEKTLIVLKFSWIKRKLKSRIKKGVKINSRSIITAQQFKPVLHSVTVNPSLMTNVM